MELLHHLVVDEHSRVPKYRQVVDSIVENISGGRLTIGQRIPSINALSEEFNLSRDTVEKAYRVLKTQNVITAVKGKGFYVSQAKFSPGVNILFLINKLSDYKMKVYQSFHQAIGSAAHIDLQVYHCDERLFLHLLNKGRSSYDHYVIMPHFKTVASRHATAPDRVLEALRQLPDHRLTILDNEVQELEGDFTMIHQDFQHDLYSALRQLAPPIASYQRAVIAYPAQSVYPYPRRILRGFRQFCVEAGLPFEVIDAVDEDTVLRRGDLFITVSEPDLVNLVRRVRDRGWQPGEQVGVISYNETPLKELLGITTVSTDFAAMGRSAAAAILEQQRPRFKNPFLVTRRRSL